MKYPPREITLADGGKLVLSGEPCRIQAERFGPRGEWVGTGSGLTVESAVRGVFEKTFGVLDNSVRDKVTELVRYIEATRRVAA